MSIEGGRWKDTELTPTPEQLSDIFTGQDNSNPVIFDPRPQTMRDLREVDRHTYHLVRVAQSILKPGNFEKTQPISLAGGLACACHSTDGIIYRSHHDLDIMISETDLETLLEALSQLAENDKEKPYQLAANIYRTQFPTDQTKTNYIDIDFFVYSLNRSGEAVFSGGSYPDINLGVNYPISPQIGRLMGKAVAVVPKPVITAMKSYDSQVRRKGSFDFEMLQR